MLRARLISRTTLAGLAVLLGMFLLAVALQAASGAFHCEFGGYPDEPAHYVTSLMVREYLTGPHPFNPMHFAEDYYLHYPKVAFGHWPPVFYILQAVWMLVFSGARASVRLEIALTTALLAFFFWRAARVWFGEPAAILASALLVMLPLVQASTDQEMAEILLTLFCFLSALYFARYLESSTYQDSTLFAVFFSMAVLTKGSGWLLTLVPPVAMLLTRNLRLLAKRSSWFGVIIVALLCLPWQLLTLQSAERGWAGGTHPSLAYTLSSLGQFLLILVDITGPVLSAVVALGIFFAVLVPLRKGPVAAAPAAMLSLLLGDWIFHSVVPAGVEDRKMILAVPALIFFLFAGGFGVADRLLPNRLSENWRRGIVTALCAAAFLTQVFSIPRLLPYGYIAAAKFLTTSAELSSSTVLVSSESGGEGLLISEVAMRQPRPRAVILRGTKELAQVDWGGSNYRSLFVSVPDLLAHLGQRHVQVVVLDDYAPQEAFPHHQLLERTVHENPGLFHLLCSIRNPAKTGRGEIRLYEFKPVAALR